MQLKTLSVTNFRNLAQLELAFDVSAIAFIGQNAQGKTNILEAIYALAIGKSLRASAEKDLIRYSTNHFRLVGTVIDSERKKLQLELAALVAPRFTKVCKINGHKVSATEFVGRLPAVFFQPEDLNLILLGPSLRRRYLDVLLSQVSRDYLRAASRYAKALKNRNALLSRIAEQKAKVDELEFWDSELARYGMVLGQLRAELIEFATDLLAQNFYNISGENKKLIARLTGFNASELTTNQYLENLKKLQATDLRYGTTNYGPHRQDLVFELDGENIAAGGSRGEIRSTILALKLTELKFLETRTGQRPLLLLDDVFSELDRGRQERLLQSIEGYQTFITTTKVEHLDSIQNKQVWEVRGGAVNLLK